MYFILKKNDVWVFPFVIIILFILSSVYFFNETALSNTPNQYVAYILNTIFIVLQSIVFNVFFERTNLFPKKTHIPILIHSLLNFYIINIQLFNVYFWLSVLLQFLVYIYYFYFLDKIHKNTISSMFYMSLFLGLSVLFSGYSWSIAVLFLIAFFSGQNINFRILLIVIFGLLLPFIYYYSFCYILDIPQGFFSYKIPSYNALYNPKNIIFLSILLISCLRGIYLLLFKTKTPTLKIRNLYSMQFIFLIGSIIILMFSVNNPLLLSFLALPISYFISYGYIYAKKNLISELLMNLFIISYIYMNLPIFEL